MRILHVTPYYAPAFEWGGPARSVPVLVDGLSDAGHDVTVYTTGVRASSAHESLPEGCRWVGRTPVHYFGALGPRRYFFSPSLAREVVRTAHEFDIIHVTGIWTFAGVAACNAADLAGVPYVISPRGSLDPWALLQKRRKKVLYFNLIERRHLEHAAGVHFTTRAEAEKTGALLKRLRSFVVANAVSIPEATGRRCEPDAELIACIGRVHPMKGFDVLIPAMEIVHQSRPRARLFIVGPEEDGYLDVVKRDVMQRGLQGVVTFTGMVTKGKVMDILSRTSALVAPSFRENFGMAVAEAMVQGVPVIVSEEVDLARAIRESRAGFVIRREAAALARAVLSVLGDPSESAAMGARGAECVRIRFSPKSVAARMVEAYEAVRKGLERGQIVPFEHGE